MIVTHIASFLRYDSVSDPGSGFTGPFSTTTEYIVAGFFVPGDGGGGTFIWIEPSVGTPWPAEDRGIILYNTNNTNGYFKRIYSGPINVRWFGAKGDGVTDDTTAVDAARDSNFIKDGTIYFPESSAGAITGYVGAFNMRNYNINILGDGVGSVLKAKNSGGPVLTLGDNPDTNWAFSKIAHIKIDGTDNASVAHSGVIFSDPNDPKFAGRWIFEEVVFKNCDKAVYKPHGNIGNSFYNCSWESNNFAYFAQSVAGMHSGCDKFIGCHITGTTSAGIYLVNDQFGFGQVILDGTIIEYNPGFGIFIKCITDNSAVPPNDLPKLLNGAIALRDVWLEGNGENYNVPVDIVPVSITDITGTHNYPVSDLRNFRFDGLRGVTVTGGHFYYAELIESTVTLNGCRGDLLSPSPNGHVLKVDALSSIDANELFYIGAISENVFVNSIGYDGTGDLWNNSAIPTSVWGATSYCRSIRQQQRRFWLCF